MIRIKKIINNEGKVNKKGVPQVRKSLIKMSEERQNPHPEIKDNTKSALARKRLPL
jgi:hypothetical protein